MKKNVVSIGFLAAGLLLCCVLPFGILIAGPAFPGANEVLSPVPSFWQKDGSWNDHFLTDCGSWFSDHFYLRQEMITAYAGMQARLFGVSASEDVLLGRDGWLFYGSTLGDYTGTQGMTEAELSWAADNLQLMREACEDQGAKFLFICALNKNTLYPQFMRNFGAVNETHDYEKLYELLADRGVTAVDMRPAFSKEILYFAHDSHWNSRGAALAADLIQNALGKESAYFADSFAGSEPHTGDLYEMLYPTGNDQEENPVYSHPLNYSFGEKSGTRPDSITIRTESDGEGSLRMFRDSFGNLLFPYLADSYGKAVFSRATAYDLTNLDADTVVVELVERNLSYLVRNLPVMPAPARNWKPIPTNGSLPLTEKSAAPALPGYKLWKGRAESADGKSPVYLLGTDKAYACFRLKEGEFAAYLPENEAVIGTAFQINGTWMAYAP